MNTECNSAYLHSTLDVVRLKRVVKHLSKIIKNKVGIDNFDAIAYRGMSGAGVATTLGYLFSKPLIMVRKKGITSHSDRLVEGDIFANRVVVIDDCISYGTTLVETVREIIDNRKRHLTYDQPFKVVAVLLYNDSTGNYYFLTGEETLSKKFFTIVFHSIGEKDENQDALKAMENMTVYNFSLVKHKNRYQTVLGSNLDIDDLK